MIQWIDAHTHLDSDELYAQKDEVLARALNAGVHKILVVNSEASEESFRKTADCMNAVSGVQRYLSFGIHPHQASLFNHDVEKMLMNYLQTPGVISFGEIGLDFYYDYSPREIQETVLKRQLKLSFELGMPVSIHCRDAYNLLAAILKEINSQWKGMIHCFTGTPQEAEMLMKLGFYISFSGIVTFRSANVLREAAAAVPLDRILIETDAPYLAPVPYRGKTNEPSYVVHTGIFLAELKKVDQALFASAVSNNFSALFLNEKDG
jgi:TatD DNase family protein